MTTEERMKALTRKGAKVTVTLWGELFRVAIDVRGGFGTPLLPQLCGKADTIAGALDDALSQASVTEIHAALDKAVAQLKSA